MNKSLEFRADIGMLFVAIAFGLGYLPTSQALASNNVFVLLFWRFFAASIIAGAIFFPKLKAITSREIKHGAVLSLFLFAGFTSQTFAFKFAQSSSVAFIIGLNVALVPFIAAALFRHKIYSYAYAGIALAIAGLYLIGDTQLGLGKGEALALVCACAYSFHIVLTNRFVQSCDVAGIAYVQILCLSVLCCFAAIFFERVSIVPVMDRSFFVAMAVICLLGTVFGFFAQALMQKYTTPVKTALFFTLEPVTAGIMGVFVGGERLSAMQILGAALILAGVLISEIGSYFSAKRSRSVGA